MLRTTTRLAEPSRCLHRWYSSAVDRHDVPPKAPFLRTLYCDIHDVPVDKFRELAFLPETPIRIAPPQNGEERSKWQAGFPERWWSRDDSTSRLPDGSLLPSQEYLSQFADTILPYEVILDMKKEPLPKISSAQDEISQVIATLLERSPDATFHRFNAPLSLFLQACKSSPPLERLYIAQAQIADLPKQLQDDLPVPTIVQKAGKGDIYDANIWMGTPPTYTPLHKDPNPNLFVQLASQKVVRLFEPNVGSRIFRDVQEKIGQHASSIFRGDEMMEGPEREALDEAVWNKKIRMECFEVTVAPGEAIFIPKGWWHSIKSKGRGMNHILKISMAIGSSP
ncbi:Lysine-specific demethylase JMJ30 [Lachnellula suecica]|uniref:Lysine-specific demethylase JMJ30 n=1 Tax=Lachnellula suecica TaxID=602035 RepID=A0A8T9CF90_9HELO|nr:Lysine-specific demethylase JMJ30 [Lachnellula suecica]